MKTRIPSCFEGFRCVGGVCKDSCCIGWEIDVDEASFQRYQQMEGVFGERLRASLATEADGTHHYILNGERCPFLGPDNLCQQIITLGESALCEICDQHPRFHAVFGEVQETGMGLACEEAARMLLSSPRPLALLERGTGEEPTDQWYHFLLDCRERLFSIAQDRSRAIPERLSSLLAFAAQAQEQLDWEEFHPLEELPPGELEILPGHGVLWLDYLSELEPIDREWAEALEDTLAAAQYPELLELFTEEMEDRAWEYEHFLYYLLFRYVMKAWDDCDLLYWVRVAVFSCLTVELLDFGRWFRNGQRFTLEDHRDTLRIFSKEIEYDPEIIEGLDGLFDTCEPFCE